MILKKSSVFCSKKYKRRDGQLKARTQSSGSSPVSLKSVSMIVCFQNLVLGFIQSLIGWIRGRSWGDGNFSRTSPSSSEVCCNILKKKVPFYVVSRICRARFRLQLHIANCVSRRVGLLCPRLLLFRDLRMDELHPETNTQWFYDCKYSIRPVATLKFPDRGH